MWTALAHIPHKVYGYLFPLPVSTISDLHRFLSGEASYLAQRSTYEFTRNTLAWFGQSAFAEKDFNEHFARCRWESFAAVLAAMILLTANRLRGSATGAAPSFDAQMIALFGAILEDYPRPAHRPEGWSDATSDLSSRLAEQPLSASTDPTSLARQAARRIFDTLPVYSHDKDENRRVITNAITFGMISFSDRLRKRLKTKELMVRLLARAPGEEQPSSTQDATFS